MTDRDDAEVGARLRRAVTASGLSQASFARALGTSASRLSTYLSSTTRPSAHFLVRAERIGDALATARARGLMSAPATSAAMRTYLLRSDTTWTWRMLLQGRDQLQLMIAEPDGPTRQQFLDSWEAEPTSAGSREWDALLAAITGHEFERAGAEEPAWTRRATLETPWLPEHPFLSPDRVLAQTPEWLKERNIFIPRRDLVTA